jgi:EmrB/QacA subfamily drug resistance transporter
MTGLWQVSGRSELDFDELVRLDFLYLERWSVALDLSIVNVAFPSMRRSFPEVSTAALSWVLAAYSVVFGALLLGAGRIADRSGRRRVFLLGLLIFTAGSLLCGIAPSAWLLIVGRVVQAIGAALLMPASLALLLSATAPAARAQAVAMWGGVSALAVATGPSLGSVLIDAGGWRWAFFVNLPVALVAGVAARRVVPESVIGGRVPDLVGVALLSAAVAALALAITQGGDWGWSSSRVVGSFAAAAVLGPIAIRRSTRHEAPAIDLDVFRSRTVVLANAATVLYSVGFFGMLLANVLFLTSVWKYSTLEAGLAITPGPLLVAALSGPSGRLAARVGVLQPGRCCAEPACRLGGRRGRGPRLRVLQQRGHARACAAGWRWLPDWPAHHLGG